MMNWMTLSSNATQRILSQSSNISYTARGVYRMGTVPDDRQADYAFRDIFMVIVTAYFTELGFRLAEKLYSFKLMTDVLGLNRLSKIYKQDRSPLLPQLPEELTKHGKDYRSITDVPALRSRIIGSLVRDKSNKLIPELFETVDLPAMPAAEQGQHKLLAHHLKRAMNFYGEQGYLDDLLKMGLPEDVGEFLKGHLKASDKSGSVLKLLSEYFPAEKSFGALDASQKTILTQLLDDAFPVLERVKALPEETLSGVKKTLYEQMQKGQLAQAELKVLTETLKDLPKRVEETLSKDARPLVQHLYEDMLANKNVLNTLVKIQKTSFWPKLVASVLFSFIVYGNMASYVDNKIVQPWQKKLVKERGTSREVVAPTYLALIPGALATCVTLIDKFTPKFVQKLGYFNRFAVGGLFSLGVYAGSVFLMIKHRLGQPPEHPPQPSQDVPATKTSPFLANGFRHPPAFQMFEALTQARSN